MNELPERKLAKSIIERIRNHPDFRMGHAEIAYPAGKVGYYIDDDEPGGPFFLKYDNIELHCYEVGYRIDLEPVSRSIDDFDIHKWLAAIDEIVEPPDEIKAHGVKYKRIREPERKGE
jgi:hypothetical protein